MNAKKPESDWEEDDDLPPQLVDLEEVGIPENHETTPVMKVPITIVTGKYNLYAIGSYI